MTDNINLTQEVTHIGTDHITITYGGDATHNSSTVTKSFNVSKADLGTVQLEDFPNTAEEDEDITFRVSFLDAGGYNPFEIDTFSMVVLFHGQYPYTENGAPKFFMSDINNGYVEITLNIGHARSREEIVLSIGDSTHYNRKLISLGTIQLVTEEWIDIGKDLDTQFDSTNTVNGIFASNQPGYLITNYTKQNTGTTITVPLEGDFEVLLEMNISQNAGTGWVALNDGTNNVLEVNMNNTVNSTPVNSVFPNPTNYTEDYESILLSRKGTTYTYEHDGEIKTFTIDNTDPLYVKLRKTGNGDMYVAHIFITLYVPVDG